MPDLSWNRRVWSDYSWPQHGEEWSAEMAVYCGVTPEHWKNSVAREFLIPHLRKDKAVLEIGAGHGRWSEIIIPRSGEVWLFDLNPSCREFLRKNFGGKGVFVPDCDGKTLRRGRVDGGEWVDFIWSFDTFVHIEEPETRSYAREFARLMKRQTMGVIHHAGNPTAEQRARGCRSQVTARQFEKILGEAGLVVIRQTDSWGECNVKLAGDVVTVFVKP
jgi:SAM-dependent methyltransferase